MTDKRLWWGVVCLEVACKLCRVELDMHTLASFGQKSARYKATSAKLNLNVTDEDHFMR